MSSAAEDGHRRALGAVTLAAGGGVAVALSLPPFGWWWLGWAGYGALAGAVRRHSLAGRLLVGWGFGLGQFGVGLFWMREFSLPGTVLAVALEALFVAVAAAATPPARPLALPAALVVVEAVRGLWPFGGLPLAGGALGQIAGPLGGAARIGGALLLVALAACVGTGLATATDARRAGAGPARARIGGVVLIAAAVMVAAAGALLAPDGGEATGTIDAVAVQGGGPRGLRAVDTDPGLTYERHLDATEAVEPGHELVLWPEDVLDLPALVEKTPEGAVLSALAVALETTFVAGVVQDIDLGGDDVGTFANEAVAWGPDGAIVDRYEKVHRVPFGEYVPFRSLISRLADVSAVPRDARVGRGPAVLRTPAGDLGVLISYEVFFSDRGRAAVGAGAEVLLVPTNASSFTDSQVPTQQVAAARLRAVEAGRDLLQVGPTGYTAVIDHRGRLRDRSVLGAQAVTPAVLGTRDGETVYARFGDIWLIVSAAAVAAGAWLRPGRRRPGRTGTG